MECENISLQDICVGRFYIQTEAPSSAYPHCFLCELTICPRRWAQVIPLLWSGRVFPGKALAPPGPAHAWAVWPLGWACSPLWQAVICHKAQALITPAISLPSRTADVINGHEIIQCLSKLQSQSVFVPVTSHGASLLFIYFFILPLYWTLTLSTNQKRGGACHSPPFSPSPLTSSLTPYLFWDITQNFASLLECLFSGSSQISECAILLRPGPSHRYFFFPTN